MTARGGMEMVVGLEVHVQLATATKLFCGCSTASFGSEPNTNVCPVCTGQPGVLPVLNGRAVDLAFTSALALGCRLRERSIFARKNFFYPDMPKGYQISQYEEPFSENGRLELPGGRGRGIGIHRIHIEEDAGKLLHAIGSEELPYSLVDFNRAGAPLIEIVSEADIRSPEEAFQYLTGLKEVLRYCGVSRCDMEKGELRCDANISVRPGGSAEFGTRTEIKNLNSFRAVKDALAYEFERQCSVLAEGGRVAQETRLWNASHARTESMRSKEEAHDYRYFPEPDLVPLFADKGWEARIRAGLPELPPARRRRFVEEYKLSEYDAGALASERALADYFEAVVKAAEPAAAGGPAPAAKELAKAAANWTLTELLAKINAEGKPIEECPVAPERLAELIGLIREGDISGKIGKDVFARMWETGEAPAALVKDLGLAQVSDAARIGAWVDEALRENPKAVADLKAGKEKAAGRIVGAVMRKSQGKANPGLVNKLIKERIP
ncbi:MAG: Asp-tRNA(Asn)/Glu-tRNA(Gln) amidotransferase subunit GatB [Elusimicrobiota bacterium]